MHAMSTFTLNHSSLLVILVKKPEECDMEVKIGEDVKPYVEA